MANTQGWCASFKQELLQAKHAFGATVARTAGAIDTFKAALFLASATLNSATTTYSTTGEASGTGYTAGGQTLANANGPQLTSGVAHWNPSAASLVWANVTLASPVDAVLVYNSSQGNAAVSVHTMGAITVNAANLTISMPAAGSTTSLLRIL